ncbi:Outer membrane protein assembly factor BamB, contains PQQ-like beta-propeller repeat [Halorubrum aquaticum]|uniref:Outer membrane protein assembly factor BamB, contains PQQ-like beta-propeller repeat n=1 Tax=Halorubrum aquaticum TaxID=387340 RepID=A0A1I3B2S3_9EURY|nr:PQQ-binding-like beta-propeller repeat protein [Halorubrum aquaticum]SFH56604.1 Outer membrane protein assembly factor BamB, contains PQQ-like beta-propeller repeat [Halorubrum aquaticum]
MGSPDGSEPNRERHVIDGTTGRSGRVSRRGVLRGTVSALSVAGLSLAGVGETVPTASATNHVPNRIVCVGSDGGSLYVVDAGTGESVWRFDEPGGSVSSSPTVVDGVAYVGSADGSLYAVDATDGSAVWSVEAGSGGENEGIVSSPTVINDRVFVGTGTGAVVALDRSEGTEEWRVEDSVSAVVSSPAIDGGTLYVGTETGEILALATSDGTERWRVTAPEDGISSSPAVVDGTLYVGSFDERLYAVDIEVGETVWNANLENVVFSSPAVVDGTVYVGSVGVGVGLHAIDAETGEGRWVTDGIAGVVSSPTVVDGTVYVGSVDGSLYAVDAEGGDPVWSTGTGDQINSSPTLWEGTVFIGNAAGELYGFDAETGDQRWSFDGATDAIFSSPTVVDLASDGHGVGSRTSLGTLGHHHVAAGIEFEGGSDSSDGSGGSTGSSGSSGSTGSDDSTSTDGSTDGSGEDDSGQSPPASADGSGSSGLTSQVPAVGLLGAAGGITVGVLAAYRFLGGSSDGAASGSDPGSWPGRSSATDSVNSAGATDTVEPETRTTGTDTTEGVDADAGSASSASESSSSAASANASSEPKADTESVEDAGSESGDRDGAEDVSGSVGGADTGGADGDALLAAVDELSSIEPVASVGPLVAYAVTDERINGGDGRILALPDAEDDRVERFGSVATDWGSVSHYDGIATVYGSGSDPYPWVLTDPIQGVATLAEHLDDPPADLAARLSPVVDAAEAMSQASRYTVRHYYLSPETVRVVGSGAEPTGIVDDWGIGSVADTPDHGTRAASPYTAPEQLSDSEEPLWRGKPDTYALGVLAYHAATGSPPADHRPAKPSEHAGVPSALDRPITRAIDPDPDERYDSIGEFARILRLAVFD